MSVNNPPKARSDLRERLVPRNRIEPRTISSSTHGVHDAVALVKRHCQAMPTAGTQGSRRARMPRNRQLSHHATILNMGCKGAIGIASPACRHYGATVTHSSRCHLDYSFQLRGFKPRRTTALIQAAATQSPQHPPQQDTKSLPKGKRPSGGPYVIPAYYASDFLA